MGEPADDRAFNSHHPQEVFVGNPADQCEIAGELEAGDFFGEECLFGINTFQSSIRASANLSGHISLAVISRKDMHRLRSKIPELDTFLSDISSKTSSIVGQEVVPGSNQLDNTITYHKLKGALEKAST